MGSRIKIYCLTFVRWTLLCFRPDNSRFVNGCIMQLACTYIVKISWMQMNLKSIREWIWKSSKLFTLKTIQDNVHSNVLLFEGCFSRMSLTTSWIFVSKDLADRHLFYNNLCFASNVQCTWYAFLSIEYRYY